MFVHSKYSGFVPCIGLCALALLVNACTVQDEPANTNWRYYKSDQASSSYSILNQINVDNVDQLEVAWEFTTKDSIFNRIQCNPLVVDGILYLTTGQLDAVALDATTGTELWRFAPTASRRDGHNANRGLMYWEGENEKRIYYGARNRIYALDATTGQEISGFGENGSIDLTKNLDREPIEKAVNSTTPGVIFEDLLIIGSSTPDGDFGSNPPGHIKGVQHPYRGAGMDIPYNPSSWRTRLRHLAGRCLENSRRREFMGRDGVGCRTGYRICPYRIACSRTLRPGQAWG